VKSLRTPSDGNSSHGPWKSTKKMHFKRNNSSHSCRTFSTVEFFVDLEMLNTFAV
jgi:hypothetical protein